jgi:hypothetical protein
MNKLIPLFIILIHFSCSSVAQDFKDLINTIQKGYSDPENLSVTMNIQVFAGKDETDPFVQQWAEFRKKGDLYCLKRDNQEMLLTSSHLIVVDHAGRNMQFSPRDKKAEQAVSSRVNINIDTLLKTFGNPELSSTANGMLTYSFRDLKGQISQIDLSINSEFKTPGKLVYHYSEGHRVEIEFVEFNLKPVFTETEFLETKFLTIQSGKGIPVEQFRNYRVNGQISQK